MTSGFKEENAKSDMHYSVGYSVKNNNIISGDNSEEVTPVPISNTVVKLFSANDTWWETAWESRRLPVLVTSSSTVTTAGCLATVILLFKASKTGQR